MTPFCFVHFYSPLPAVDPPIKAAGSFIKILIINEAGIIHKSLTQELSPDAAQLQGSC